MTEPKPAVLTGEALTAHLLQHEAARKLIAERHSASPMAVEAALSSIAEEVMTEAIERRRLAALEASKAGGVPG